MTRAHLASLISFLLLAAAPAGAASITGVCPDGSIFIVQDRSRIPCTAAKEVDPNDVPPVRPQYLPRPYAWQVYREGANPNNPYNLIDAARRVREMRLGMTGAGNAPGVPTTEVTPRGAFGAGTAQPAMPGVGTPPPAWAARPPPSVPDLALSEDDVRDLFLIVELSQQAAPGRFVKEDVQGEPSLEVSFAWSGAFETRYRETVPQGGGAVLLFTVLAHQPDAFHPNFTFVQGHETFSPRADDPSQLGFLEGGPGELPAEGVALGYVVLPGRMDPDESFDLYWNDRRIETLLRP
ncbi:MAG TPA: hypothetical protein VKB65_02325 [Myxococcota bacterium]|nr:hypothetical protein [Myxococcota bacterium]